MKSLMRYKIISGRTVEKRDVLMDVSLDPTTKQKRTRGKRRGRMVAAQVERNCNEAIKRLARVLNCNYGGGDLFLSLKYSDVRLPDTKDAAKREAKNFIRRICRAYLKATGKKLRWALVTADRSSKTGQPVRLHHHVVMDAVTWELIAAHWPSDQFSYRRLDGSGDYTAIARYMIQNAGYDRGARTWSTSQGLDKPIFTAPEPVKGVGSFQVPKDARIVEREIRQDEDSGFYAAYIRYVLPEALNTREQRGWTGATGKAKERRIAEVSPGLPGVGGKPRVVEGVKRDKVEEQSGQRGRIATPACGPVRNDGGKDGGSSGTPTPTRTGEFSDTARRARTDATIKYARSSKGETANHCAGEKGEVP